MKRQIKRLFDWCPQPQAPNYHVLRQYSKPVLALLTASIVVLSILAVSFYGLSHPVVTPLLTEPTPTPTAMPSATSQPTAPPQTGVLTPAPQLNRPIENTASNPTPSPSPTPNDYRKGFPGYATYSTYTAVDNSSQPYINIKTTGSTSQGDNWTQYGTVTWIGSPENSTKSLTDIHLIMYTRLDNTTPVHFPFVKFVEIHVEAYQNGTNVTLPHDIIDHAETIIPKLGIDNPQYAFNLTCKAWA